MELPAMLLHYFLGSNKSKINQAALINALLHMLTVTGQNEDISHGLQIGKDQIGDNQRDETVTNSIT